MAVTYQHRVQTIKRQQAAQRKALPTLSVADSARLMHIFQEKNWNLDMENPRSIFNRYINTLSKLNTQQQNLLLNLTKRFRHIPQIEYVDKLLLPLQQLLGQNKGKKVYFLRCVSEQDVDKVKSCDMVYSLLRGSTLRTKVDMSNCICVQKGFTELNEDKINLGKALLVFVDDFIGTGETALAAWKYLQKLVPTINNNSSVAFLAIVAMEEGECFLRSRGFKVYVQQTINKGISDYYKGIELDNARQTMISIEDTMSRLDKDFKFGYKQSEGLISMERCPNNTFPVYWLPFNSPYERRINEI